MNHDIVLYCLDTPQFTQTLQLIHIYVVLGHTVLYQASFVALFPIFKLK